MTIDGWLNPSACERIAALLLHFIWQGAAVAVAAAWLAGLLPLGTPEARYRWWLGVLVVQAACPAVTWWWTAPTTVLRSGPAAVTAVVEPADGVGAAPLVVLAWMAGVTVLSLRLLVGLVAAERLRRRGEPLPEGIGRIARRMAERMGIAEARVYGSRRVCEAVVVGLWRPLVLVPAAWLVELPPDVLEAIIAHELAHVRRWDRWINLFQRVVETVLFYHPAVWWVSGRVRIEREKCCDAWAVRATGQRVRYAEALALVAGRRVAESRPLLAMGMGGKSMMLLDRIQNVLGVQGPLRKPDWWLAGVMALGAGLALWVSALALSPRNATADDEQPRGDRGRAAAQREADADAAAARRIAPRAGGERAAGEQEEQVDMATLLRMVRELREEVALLRRELRAREGRESAPPRGREGAEAGARPRAEGARDGERPSAERREGQRPSAEARDGERPAAERRDGERPRGGVRDGDRARTGGGEAERAAPVRRDGERGEGERSRGERTGQAERDGERAAPREGERPAGERARGERSLEF